MTRSCKLFSLVEVICFYGCVLWGLPTLVREAVWAFYLHSFWVSAMDFASCVETGGCIRPYVLMAL
uniref:Uncharacterized protein n=1 Tax=Rhizophora mucronata TaxID=61149 RepID=A0A2P2KEF5_RHIMU